MLLVAAVREELGDVPGEVVGVGPVVAAAGAARVLERTRPDAVVLVGTAGAYPGGPPVGEAVVAERVGMSHGVAAMGLGYVPRAPTPIHSDPALLSRVDLPHHHVLTVAAVTTDLALAARLSEGWSVEHMEAWSVAHACQQVGVPFVAVLGIANVVGPDAHAQWLSHRDGAQRRAREAAMALFS